MQTSFLLFYEWKSVVIIAIKPNQQTHPLILNETGSSH
ncbi:hypothetical protein SOHN41_04049 [Shewanella sp. HN-41]|nr:hypothetical protein SOHN41_04049 [Shewanella sp. HN-41]